MKIVMSLCCLFFTLAGVAQKAPTKNNQQIKQQLQNLRTAHLDSDMELANKIYHPKLILTSQSGKIYNREVALLNIKNTFESYESSEIEFLNLAENVILTNYINERKYKDFDKGTYRLTVIWKKHEGSWKIISMQSSKIKKRIKK